MARSDGSVIIDTRMNTDGFGKGVKSMKSQVNGLIGAVGKLGVAIGLAFSVKKLIDFGNSAIDLGSDLQEVQNVVDVTFSSMSDQVNKFAEGAAEAAGLSETMAKKYVGTFGAMAKAFGFAENEAFGMSTSLTQLAGDVASFYNLTQDEAYTKLKSVFTGETESLKDLGVVMTQTALDSFAMAKGYGKTTKAMTEQEKVALRYSFVMEQLSSAQGDFARTSDSWANQTKILSLTFDSFKANIGQALINIFTPFLKILNQIVAKMAEFSKGFVAFSEMLVGKSTSGGGGSPGEAQAEIAQGYEDIADATNDATKAQKQYMTGLDEIRTFQSPQVADSSVGGGIGAISPTETEKSNEGVTETNSLMDKLIQKVKQLKDLFVQGVVESFGDTTEKVYSLKDSFESIKKSLSSIFDVDLIDGFDGFIQRITESFGTLTGSFAAIGLNIGTNLVGGISGYLESEAPNIKEYLLSMFDIGATLSEKGEELSKTFAYIFESFASENGQQITEDLIAIFANPFMSITELLGQFALDVADFLIEPFANSKEEIKNGLDDLLSGFSEFTGSVREIFSDFFELVNQLYSEHIAPIFEELMPEMEALWQEHIAPLLSKVGEFFGKLGENIKILWDEVFKPLIEWFSDNIMPVISPILEVLGKIFIGVFGSIADAIGNLLDIFGGLIDFITGVFTGDWEKAWNGIKDIFAGIWDLLVTIIKTPINGIIGIINALIDGVAGGINLIIDGINSLSFEVPDWVPFIGGSKLGFDIPRFEPPKIPYLATGAVIPPNAPFMAMLGDQKHGTNIEAPLDTIKQAVREVVGNGSGGQYAFTAQINRRTLFEEMIDEAKLRQSTSGRNPFELA